MHPGSCPRHQMRPPRPPRSIGRAISTVFPIAVILILLPPIAFASPPDPSWIAGIYDGGDGDDIVTLVYETSGSDAPALSHMLPPPSCLTETSFASIVYQQLPGDQSTGDPRSPPTIVPSHLFNSLPDYAPATSPSLAPVPAHPSPSSVRPDGGSTTDGT